jgi:hypothetical protein
MFGREIKQPSIRYWGARAIYEGRAGKYFIDILFDRQFSHGEPSKEFYTWINDKALPWLRKEVERIGLGVDEEQVLKFEDGKYYLEATPNRSYGYLYIGAIERPEVKVRSESNGV